MKAKIEVQYSNKNINTVDIEKLAKEDLKGKGMKMSEIKALEVYFKPEDQSIYYVATTKEDEVVGNDEALYIEVL